MFSDAFKSDIEEDFAVAYLKLIRKYYYKQITVTKLVETAGYGRATFYGYYSGLKELRVALFEYDIDQVTEACKKMLQTKDVTERRRIITDFANNHIKKFWPLISENNNAAHANNMKNSVMKVFAESFQMRYNGVKFDSEMIADFCITGIMQMILAHYSGNESMKTPQSDDKLVEFADYILFMLDSSGLN